MTFWWQRWDQQYSHKDSRTTFHTWPLRKTCEGSQLRGCAEKHITVTARKKEELIAALMEAGGAVLGSKKPDPSIATAESSSEDLIKLILTMQR